jgi:hypothetical protein
VKESFLPFWATSADVAVLLKGAQLGYDSWQPVYNPATRYIFGRCMHGAAGTKASLTVVICARTAMSSFPQRQGVSGVCTSQRIMLCPAWQAF